MEQNKNTDKGNFELINEVKILNFSFPFFKNIGANSEDFANENQTFFMKTTIKKDECANNHHIWKYTNWEKDFSENMKNDN